MAHSFRKDTQFYKFCLYGFLKNLRFFDPFLILFFMSKGLSFLEIGTLYSVKELVIMITEIPSGIISDALGRRKTLAFSFFIYILSFVVFYISSGFFILLIAMILFALGEAFRSGVHKSIIFAYLQFKGWENQKVEYYGKTRSWSQIGSAISAIIAAVLVFYKDQYEYIFLLSVIPYVFDLILILSYPKFLDGEKTTFSLIRIFTEFKKIIMATIVTIKRLAFVTTLLSLSIYTAFYKITKDYIQPMIKLFALSIPVFAIYNNNQRVALTTGIVYSILFVLSALASRNASRLKGITKNYRLAMNITLILGLGMGILMAALYYNEFTLLVIIGFALIIIIENLRKPIGVSLISDISEDKAMATTLSITSQAKSVLAAIMAPLLGYFADLYSPGIAIGIISTILLFVIPVFWLRNKG